MTETIHLDDKQLLNALYQIKSLSGTLSKQTALSSYAGCKRMRQFFYYATNPAVTYGVTPRKGLPMGREGGEPLEFSFDALNRLAAREVTGQAALGLIRQTAMMLSQEASILFGMILKRNLRIGIGPVKIRECFPGIYRFFKVMLASQFSPNHLDFPLYTSPKIDGIRGYFTREDKNLLYTRSGKEITSADHILEAADFVEERFDLDGELAVPRTNFNESSGAARTAGNSPDLVYYVFDMINRNSPKEPFHKRLQRLDDLARELKSRGCTCIRVLNHKLVNNETEMYYWHDLYLDAGFEGSVLKAIDHEYIRKRSVRWMKVVQEFSADVVVTGVYEGQGKYEKRAGGISVVYEGKSVNVGSGFTDAQRLELWEDPDKFIGCVAEVKYKEVTPDGSLRHNRFFRWRGDKVID